MGQYIKPIIVGAIATLVALIVYDMFVRGLVGNFESQNYDVDERGNIMKVA